MAHGEYGIFCDDSLPRFLSMGGSSLVLEAGLKATCRNKNRPDMVVQANAPNINLESYFTLR
jgi:hypothetical protein